MDFWRNALGISGLVLGLLAAPAGAEQPVAPLRIGVFIDMSGVFSDISGPGAVLAIKMAVEDYDGSARGRPIEVLKSVCPILKL
jgi:branched-chain amino acid transport system substrate-binding protein